MADIILSDILHDLDLDSINFEDNYCTKNFKGVNNDFNDYIYVKDILYEIIENLDLLGRRYKLVYEETPSHDQCSRIHNKINEDYDFNFTGFQDSNVNNQQLIDDLEISHKQEQFFKRFSDLEDNRNSHTLYVNRKFNISEPSSSDTCVYHTLNHVFGHLKLENSYEISQPSTYTCEPIKTVNFFEKFGILQKNQKKLCALHIPAIKRGGYLKFVLV